MTISLSNNNNVKPNDSVVKKNLLVSVYLLHFKRFIALAQLKKFY